MRLNVTPNRALQTSKGYSERPRTTVTIHPFFFFTQIGDAYPGPSTKSGVENLNFDNLAMRSLPLDPQSDVYPRQVNPEGRERDWERSGGSEEG